MARIGVLGGTFDPIHKGHLMIGHYAYKEYGLDEIWFMPSGIPPHKKDHTITETKERCEMVRLAIADFPYFKLSEFEVKREGNTYTAETLRLLNQEFVQHDFYFIIGADSLFQLETWHRPELVMSQTTLLVAGRDYPDASCTIEERIAELTERYQAKIFRIHCGELDIASAEIRKKIADGKPVEDYLPSPVLQYISTRKLYQENKKIQEKAEL